jgi:hypothetical protein
MAIGAACAALGCTATTEPTLTKEEAAERTVTGAADGVDLCHVLGWYGDGVCDEFCLLADQDCTGGVCTVGDDTTCAEGVCVQGECGPDCSDETCCTVAHCVVPDPDFCTDAFCGPGTRCDESLDRCVADDADFCTDAFCGPGTRCDEAVDRCVTDDPSFCREAFCGPGTRCDEATDSCVPFAGCEERGCGEPCEYGYRLGPDGCPTCDCNAEPVRCVRHGCSGRLCVPEGFEPIFTTCDDRPSDACYDIGTCELQPHGLCGWTSTPEFLECMEPFTY